MSPSLAAPRLLAPSLLRWAGWRHLPRDARDTIFLLFVIGWTVLPHVSHLPVWCSLLTLVVLLWRAQLALGNAPLPSRWWLAGVLLVTAALTLYTHQTLLGKEPGVTMAVVLMGLKTLELRARRDAFVVFFLGFFLILTHFLYSQSMLVALAMVVSVWGLLTALVLAHMPVGQPSLAQAARLSARTALFGAPIMVLLFVLFPRVGPLWGVPQDSAAKTGLSNTMRMGSVAELAQDDSVAMRLRFEGEPPAPGAMYFRGPVLTRFDGTEWRATPPRVVATTAAPADLSVRGAPVRYEMTLEPLRVSALPLLDATPAAPAIEGHEVRSFGGLEWRTERGVFERLRFNVVSYPDFVQGRAASAAELVEFTALPASFNPRTHAWAAAMKREPAYAKAAPGALAEALMQHIRTENFSYTLAPGEYGTDSVDEFWFDRREGFCEHFAAAFVVLMREFGVPARIVTGYQGTDAAPVDGYHIVRQSAAHAWAEYWAPGRGWVRADPTAAVAPERISRSSRLTPSTSLVEGALRSVSPEFLARWRGTWEAMNNRWNQWVLNYSRGTQVDVMRWFGISAPNWEDMALLLIGALSTLALAGAVWAWWDRHRVDPWVRQAEHLRVALRAIGVDAAPHDAPRALAARVRDRFGAQGDTVAALLDVLERQRYGRAAAPPRPDASLTRRFQAGTRALRGALAQPLGAR